MYIIIIIYAEDYCLKDGVKVPAGPTLISQVEKYVPAFIVDRRNNLAKYRGIR